MCDNRVFVRCQYDGQYNGNVVFCEVTGRRVNHGVELGMEVPCVYKFYGHQAHIKKLQEIVSKQWQFICVGCIIKCAICYQLLPFVFDVKLGRTNAPLTDRSVVLVIPPLVSDSTLLLSVSFIHIFIELYNCFTACFIVEFTIATDTAIYNQYQAVFFARRYISEKSAWGRG